MIIHIPALKDSIGLGIKIDYKNTIQNDSFMWHEDDDPMDDLLKLPAADHTANLSVSAMLYFPPADGEGHSNVSENHYTQVVRAVFPQIVQKDGMPVFTVKEKIFQGEPLNPQAQSRSPFRFIDGRAWITATDNPKFVAIKFIVVLGSPDVIVTNYAVTENRAVSTVTTGTSGEGSAKPPWPFDKIIDFEAKLSLSGSYAYTSPTGNTTSGRSVTIGQLAQTREFTLLLELPERKKPPEPPKPTVIQGGDIHFMYFDTAKKDVTNYLNPRYKTDQVKDLYRFVDGQLEKFGSENAAFEIKGFASGLGDTLGNDRLSEERARFVADLIKRRYGVRIPDNKILARGEPTVEGNGKENKWESRNVMVTFDGKRVIPAGQP